MIYSVSFPFMLDSALDKGCDQEIKTDFACPFYHLLYLMENTGKTSDFVE